MYFRWFIGLPLAAIVTAGLFSMMAFMIRNPVVETVPERDPIDLGILFDFKETPPDPHPVPPRPTNDPPPDHEPIKYERSNLPGSDGFAVEPIDNVIEINIAPEGFPKPVIKHPPQYPEACRSRGATGVVLVQFDVTPEGNVVNPIVLETPDRCFNRTVIATISKWKYPPAYKNGRAVMKYGLVERFSFQFE